MEQLTHQSTADDDEELKDPFCDPNNPRTLSFEDVKSARAKIESGIICTPCMRSRMSDELGMEIYFKLDCFQFTGSFKERGARYALLMLNDEQKKTGVISASLGNHAQAICYHGYLLHIPVTVVMPVVAPIMKISKCQEFKANVVVQGQDMAEAKRIAMRLAKSNGLMYINGYDHPHIMAGQGTIGMEIMEQVEDVDAVVIPVGGGGLIAGAALAIKTLKPSVRVIGVESDKCAGFSKAMQVGKPAAATLEATLADGLAVPVVGVNAFKTARPLIDKMIVLDEVWIASAILKLIEVQKLVVEGAGATTLAALLAGNLKELTGKKIVLVVSGGNIDTTVLGRCLERGLAVDGRLVKVTVIISDRPGGLAELAQIIASTGVSVKDIMETRAWVTQDVFSVEATIVCETHDANHAKTLGEALKKHYPQVTVGHNRQGSICST